MGAKSPAAPFVALVVFATLAACGGGGGGGTLPAPVSNPGGSPGPSATHSPTPGPTNPPATNPPPTNPPQTPTPQPPTPTPAPTQTPSSAVTPFAFTWDVAGEGTTPRPFNGHPALDNQFKMSNTSLDTQKGDFDGDLMPNDPGAKPGGGGQGPLGNVIDGVSCDANMKSNYHVHVYVGLFVNGRQIVIPDGTGMYHSGGDMVDSANWPNQEVEAFCFYRIHTHDESGMVHLEAMLASPPGNKATVFNVGQWLDIFGVQVSSSQFGPFMGSVTVYTSGQFSRESAPACAANSCEVGANMYSLWTGSPTNIPLYSHEVIWYEVGSGNPDARHLPGVSFALFQ